MNTPLIKKVINASAGTGKTYRLSLEYLSILLNHRNDPDFSFKNITVITFTRKATSEIREAVFERIDKIVNKNDQNTRESLEKIFEKPLSDDDLGFLLKVSNQMLIKKEDIRITTIDSFINTIFKSMIAPVLKITSYQMDEKANLDLFPKLFETILRSPFKDQLKDLLKRQNARNFSDAVSLLEKLIQQRWLLYYLKKDQTTLTSRLLNMSDQDLFSNAEQCKKDIINLYNVCLDSLESLYLSKKSQTDDCSDWLSSDFKKILSLNSQITWSDFRKKLLYMLQNDRILNHIGHFSSLVKNPKFWNGTKTRSLKEPLTELENSLSVSFLNYFLNQYLSKENKELLIFWETLLKEYDKLKMKSKVFTFDDILWYTFENLYKENNALLDTSAYTVTNEFYEYLSNKIQYFLIDEFQDTGIMQLNIFKPVIREILSGTGVFSQKGVIIVGDEKQSIYEWRGGERNLLLQMPAFLGLSANEKLSTCFRSNQQIINLINKLFAQDNFTSLFTDDNKWLYVNSIKAHCQNNDGLLKGISYLYKRSQTNLNDVEDTEEENDDSESKVNSKNDSYKVFVEKMIVPYLNQIEPSQTAIIARTNKDLNRIEAILREKNISCVRDSSQSLFDHPMIKNIMQMLKFITWNDYLSLLAFLRSDVALYHQEKFRDVIMLISRYQKRIISESDFLLAIQSFPEIQPLLKIRQTCCGHDDQDQEFSFLKANISEIIFQLIRTYDMIHIYENENEIKNLHLFMEKVFEFDLNPAPYTHSLDGFLLYCSEYEKKETYKQTGVKIDSAIDLLTIHKSKGLSYHTVFVYTDITSKTFQESFLMYYRFFPDNCDHLLDMYMSANYSSLLLKLHPQLKENIIRKAWLEDLNNLYVALTRAEKNMGIFLACCINKSQEIPDDDTPGKIIWHQLFSEDEEWEMGCFNPAEKKSDQNIQPLSTNTDLIRKNELLQKKPVKIMTEEAWRVKTESYLNQKAGLIGSIVHEYLSHIIYNSNDEQIPALQQTIRKYGNLLSGSEIEQLCRKASEFADSHPELYDRTWDKVFNEFELHDKGKTFRLDRLMINTEKKEILIVDYKTGGYSDEQIAHYASIISSLPVCNNENYTVKTIYVEV